MVKLTDDPKNPFGLGQDERFEPLPDRGEMIGVCGHRWPKSKSDICPACGHDPSRNNDGNAQDTSDMRNNEPPTDHAGKAAKSAVSHTQDSEYPSTDCRHPTCKTCEEVFETAHRERDEMRAVVDAARDLTSPPSTSYQGKGIVDLTKLRALEDAVARVTK